jgi:hypothetical protein
MGERTLSGVPVQGVSGNTSEFTRKGNDLLGMGIMLSDCGSCMPGGVTSLQLNQTEVISVPPAKYAGRCAAKSFLPSMEVRS